MKKGILWMGLSFLLVAALVLASCGPAVPVGEQEEEEEEEEEEEVVSAVGEPIYGGTLTGGMSQVSREMQSANLTLGDWAQESYADPFLEHLVIGDIDKYGPRGTGESSFGSSSEGCQEAYIVGQLAESWEVTPDKLIYTIRPGVYWNADHVDFMETREVTAKDLEASWLHWRATDLGAATSYFVNEVYAEGNTLVFTWDTPDHVWAFWAGGGAGGTSMIPPEVIEAGPEVWTNQVGTGPFILTEVVPASYAKYEMNPIYWGTTTIDGVEYPLPFVDKLIYPVLPDESMQISALRTGKLDFLHTIELMYEDSLAESAPELITLKTMGGGRRMVDLQCAESKYAGLLVQDTPYTDGMFSNPDLRRALSYATDQQALGETVFEDFVLNAMWLPLGGVFHTSVAEMPEAARMMYEYQPELARKLMTDAGYPHGFRMELVIGSTPLDADIGAVLKEQWAKVGIDVTLKPVEAGVYAALRFSHAYKDAILAGEGTCIRQFVNFTSLRRTILTGLYDPYFDAMYLRGAQTIDVEERAEIFKAATMHLIERGDFLMLPSQYQMCAWWPWIKNYYGELNMGYCNMMPAIARMWIDEGVKAELGF